MTKVSIIVPIYNVEKYLPKCLDSLINQTFKDIEIWAISDGSPDNSVDIIKKYAKKDDRVKCIEKENGGYGSVLEYAIERIKTEYFLICDPDDWLREDAIEILYSEAKKEKVDLVVGAKYLVYNDSNEEVYDDSIIKNINLEIKEKEKYSGDELGKAFFLTPSPHSKLYKTKYAKKIKFPRKVSFTDFLLYSLYINECQSFMYISDALSYYLVDRPGNTMTDVNPKVFDYHCTVFESVIKQSNNQKITKYFYSHMLDHLRYVYSEAKKIADRQVKEEKSERLFNLLKLLQEHGEEINAENYIFNKKIALYNRLLLNKFTGKIFFKRYIK